MKKYSNKVRHLDHAAYRCRDTEETREFYEDILGLRLSAAVEISATKTGRSVKVLHSFFEMDDGSFIAFFEDPANTDESMFRRRHDFELHLALSVNDSATLLEFKSKFEAAGYEVRGPSDHGFCQSIYVYDPNGYILELAARTENYDKIMAENVARAHEVLSDWQRNKSAGLQ